MAIIFQGSEQENREKTMGSETAVTVEEIITIDARLRHWASACPDDFVIGDSKRSLTWRELDGRINKVANALLNAGLKPGGRVAALARNSLHYVELVFGTLRAGGCIVPLQTMASAENLIGMINDSRSAFLLMSEEFAGMVMPLAHKLTSVVGDRLMNLDYEGEGRDSLEALIEGVSDIAPDIPLSLEAGSNLVYSSGTTGKPKGILQSHGHKARECMLLADLGLSPKSKTLISTPMCSSTTVFILFGSLGNGGSAILMEKFNAEQFLNISEKEKISHAILVPVQYERILNVPDFDRYDLSSYEAKVSIGAPLHKEKKLEILDRWPAGGLLELYGMTEGGPGCALVAHDHLDKLDTVGQPAKDCDLKIISDDGEVLPQGEVGEIVGWSPAMMIGYENQPEATREASWYDETGKRYHRSGDNGWLDEDGFLHLLDRKKDMIITGGFNIYAIDIERVLAVQPEVLETAVIGVPSKEWGETPVAYVVPKDKKLDLEELRARVNGTLGKVQRISAIRPIDELPRNPIGKILKRELKERWKMRK